jgi:hypothetical protein
VVTTGPVATGAIKTRVGESTIRTVRSRKPGCQLATGKRPPRGRLRAAPVGVPVNVENAANESAVFVDGRKYPSIRFSSVLATCDISTWGLRAWWGHRPRPGPDLPLTWDQLTPTAAGPPVADRQLDVREPEIVLRDLAGHVPSPRRRVRRQVHRPQLPAPGHRAPSSSGTNRSAPRSSSPAWSGSATTPADPRLDLIHGRPGRRPPVPRRGVGRQLGPHRVLRDDALRRFVS